MTAFMFSKKEKLSDVEPLTDTEIDAVSGAHTPVGDPYNMPDGSSWQWYSTQVGRVKILEPQQVD